MEKLSIWEKVWYLSHDIIAWTVVTTIWYAQRFTKRIRDLRKSIGVRNMP